MTRALDLTGKKFGRLTVIERTSNDKHGKTRWLCECECGNNVISYGSDLNRGKTKSCGCIQKIHGLSKHRLYNIFAMMKDRCYNPENISYPWYGGQGIKIYQLWLDDYTKFHEWALRNGYKDNLEIDRIDSSKDYSPENCRWVTRRVQNLNQRLRKDNTSGIRGVKWNQARRKWEVNISVNKKRIYLGLYEELEDAAEARRKAEEKYW
ncbi:AP2 domain-containing protein [Ornithinibacillus sp. JPR2-1]|uniref:AP2 domain-containing protein n=1 Tax=Ornithinibacillus sp. JPR2-1 TaxID=2094019 RepID=UPI0031CFDD61